MMLFQLIQAGMEHKKNIRTLIKQASDNYLLDLQKVKVLEDDAFQMNSELEFLRSQNDALMRLNEEQKEIPKMSFSSKKEDSTPVNKKPRMRIDKNKQDEKKTVK